MKEELNEIINGRCHLVKKGRKNYTKFIGYLSVKLLKRHLEHFQHILQKSKRYAGYALFLKRFLMNKIKMERFRSDLQLLFEMLKYRKDKNALIRFVKEHRDYFERRISIPLLVRIELSGG